MNIQDALKETGRAQCEQYTRYYAQWDGSCLQFYSKDRSVYQGLLAHDRILKDDWQPYPIKKEIRPENAGELWRNAMGVKFFSFFDNDKEVCLCMIDQSGDRFISGLGELEHFTHNQNGWARLYPPVEDENIERIIIEPYIISNVDGVSTYNFKIKDGYMDRICSKSFTLEIPKEPK